MGENTTIPRYGGNWSHYFVCSDGTPITYSSIKTDSFYCPDTQENLSGEQYDTSWRTLRHRELIREVGVISSLAFVSTGNSSEAKLAKDILIDYSILYPSLLITDKLNRTVDVGGKLTSQSLDEAVFLIELAWMYHLINPTLNTTEKDLIEENLLMGAVSVLQTEGNQNRGDLSNWFTYHNAAIGMVAAATKNHSLMNESLYSDNGLINQIVLGFDSDGFWHEGSIAYHNYTLTAMALHLEAAEYMGIDLFDFEWEDKDGNMMQIKDPFVAHLKLIRPDMTFPRLNDAIEMMTIIDVMDLLEFANFHWDEEIVASILVNVRNQAPIQTYRSILWASEIDEKQLQLSSVDFPDFGISVIRMNSHYVLIDYGPHGGWHGHRDKLNLEIVTPYGAVFEDPGTVRYSLPASNEWYRSSFAHTTISFDDQEQLETTGYLIGKNHSTDGSVVVAGFADSENNLTVQRSLVVLPIESGIVVFDRFQVNLESNTSISRTYHYRNSPNLDVNSLNISLNPMPEPARNYSSLEMINSIDSDFFWINYTTSDFSSFSLFPIHQETKLFHGSSINEGQCTLIREENLIGEVVFEAVHVIQEQEGSDFQIDFDWTSSERNRSFFNSSSFSIDVNWNEDFPLFTKQPSIPSV